ncbi:MAG TPA: 1-phosphofructokinase [Clostridia bacterium]|nr:1-phosphofructokinase [Clostridia bacterium]
MIITVTLNPALDKTLTVPFFAVGEVNRAAAVRLDPGGKGVNVSKVLKALGGESVATGILGGAAGKSIAFALGDMGIRHDFVYADGETRTNLKIVDPERHTHTDVNEPGAPVKRGNLEALQHKLLSLAKAGDTVLFAGSSPRGVEDRASADMALLLKQRGVRVAADLDGGRLSEMRLAKPFLIKPNERELKEMMNLPDTETATLVFAARALVQYGIGHVIVSRGEKGAIFADEAGVLIGFGPKVEAVSTVGAGDAMMAAYLYAIEKECDRGEAARFAVAVATAKVMRPGSSPPSREEVEAYRSAVAITTSEEQGDGI